MFPGSTTEVGSTSVTAPSNNDPSSSGNPEDDGDDGEDENDGNGDLWAFHTTCMSSRSERAEIVKEIRETYTYMAHMEKSIDWIASFWYGLRSSIQSEVPGYLHCGLVPEPSMGRLLAFANICNKRVDKEAVEEAFKLTCSTKINILYHMDLGLYAGVESLDTGLYAAMLRCGNELLRATAVVKSL
ncbi:peptidase C13, legumain [Artemisia annua]|uniref:Peptidase C13, legumain n=1 Tax=Artemisia annua TaxID=35608 RepID=A0A2U1PC09_ARTAN|nr:peptidase C13, legumain [Artemisia annua]